MSKEDKCPYSNALSKVMLTNIELFFCCPDAKKIYGHKNIEFPRPFK
jgi:hypothetical protein